MKIEYGFKVSILSEDDGGGFLVEVPELPGCMTDGDTIEEAVEKLSGAIELWIDTAHEMGKKIPKPSVYQDEDPSGKFTTRVPKSMHKDLIKIADEQGVSLNSLVNCYLAKGIGYDQGKKAGSEAETKTRRFADLEVKVWAAITEQAQVGQDKWKNKDLPFLRRSYDFINSPKVKVATGGIN